MHDSLRSREACHCHDGYHGDSCEYIGCDPNPCRHGGKCHEGEANFTCICETGYVYEFTVNVENKGCFLIKIEDIHNQTDFTNCSFQKRVYTATSYK